MKKSRIAVVLCLAILMGAWHPLSLSADDRDVRERDLSRIRKKIETLRVWQLTEELDLDEATSSRLFPAMKRADKERWEIENRNRKLIRGLSGVLEDKDPHPGKINQILDELQANRRELMQSEERHIETVRQILSPADTARYLLFQIRFEARIKQKAAEAMRERRELEGREDRSVGSRSDDRDSGGHGSDGGGGSSGGGNGRR
ncbi:MAG: hypothetical protein PVJ01_02860 [Pseudomonadota bacterium]|jgi:uncharacterized membrane protein YgcG